MLFMSKCFLLIYFPLQNIQPMYYGYSPPQIFIKLLNKMKSLFTIQYLPSNRVWLLILLMAMCYFHYQIGYIITCLLIHHTHTHKSLRMFTNVIDEIQI